MINAKSNEILIGGSTSINLYVLSNALKHIINPGDEVIVTNQDHEANISPWRRLGDYGAKIIEWKFNLNDIKQADEAYITSATQFVMPVIKVDNIKSNDKDDVIIDRVQRCLGVTSQFSHITSVGPLGFLKANG